MHTHFHPPTKSWFTAETCDTCGSMVMGPNTVKLYNPSVISKLTMVAHLPSEIMPLDDGSYGCEECS